MELSELWARADACFVGRKNIKMKGHAEAVVKWAGELMARGEPGRPEIVIPAAILHDVGIPAAIELYGNSSSPGQEVEGAVVARMILVELGCDPHQIEAICGIVGVHHHRLQHPTPEFRLIYDADLLVNAQESGNTYEQVADRFYTATARELAKGVLSS